ncbi:MAG: hypothetical protein AUI33_14355, partial [Ignavibacteria bacterium 13_1_40CM_2_61_4]
GYKERRLEVEGFPVRVTSYQIGGAFHASVDNVEPGARIARGEGQSRAEAEEKALSDAARRLARTRRHPV